MDRGALHNCYKNSMWSINRLDERTESGILPASASSSRRGAMRRHALSPLWREHHELALVAYHRRRRCVRFLWRLAIWRHGGSVRRFEKCRLVRQSSTERRGALERKPRFPFPQPRRSLPKSNDALSQRPRWRRASRRYCVGAPGFGSCEPRRRTTQPRP